MVTDERAQTALALLDFIVEESGGLATHESIAMLVRADGIKQKYFWRDIGITLRVAHHALPKNP